MIQQRKRAMDDPTSPASIWAGERGQRPRAAIAAAGALLGLMLAISTPVAVALAVTPTPTRTPAPTPSALPSGRNANSNFTVDQDAELPWPLPLPPTFPVASATPTLYNATALHATGYPNQVGTATAQIGQFTGPVNAVSTPVAGLINAAPTPNGTDLGTGQDLGTGSISFTGFASDLASDIGPIVGTAVGFISGILDLLGYSPVLIPIVVAEIAVLVISLFMFVLPLIIKAGRWLLDFVVRLFTLIGSWVPG